MHRLWLLKTYGDGAGMSERELLDCQAALYVLKGAGCTLPMTEIVGSFLKSWKAAPSTKTISEYFALYRARKVAKKKAAKTLKEIDVYLKPFLELFGHQKPNEISWEAIDLYLSQNTCRWHRDRALRAFFDWMAGKSRSLAVLPDIPLERSPFVHIERPAADEKDETAILFLDEAKNLIRAAKGTDQLAWVVWGLFTGSRPEAEAKHMWHVPRRKRETDADYERRLEEKAKSAWRHINLDMRTATIFSSKLGGKSRQMILQPNVVEWLRYFHREGLFPRYSRRHFRELKNTAIPAKADVEDILRHTTISNLVKLRGTSGVLYSLSDVAAQCGTSVKMIEKHYLAQISNPAEVAEFWSLTPASFGLA